MRIPNKNGRKASAEASSDRNARSPHPARQKLTDPK